MLVVRYTKKDFKVDTFNAGGPGGQHQNKKQTGVRITHLPTGLVAESRETRSQDRNKKLAFRRLAKLILDWHRQKDRTDYPISEEVIRTYHEPDNRVKDHASGLQQTYKEVVLDNHIDDMIYSRRRAL